MRGRLFLFSVCILISSFVSAQSKKKIKELKIKTSTETVTLYKDGVKSVTYKSDYQAYDKDGNTTLDIEYNQDGTVKKKETHTYSGGNKTEEILEHPNDVDDNNVPVKYKKTDWKYNSAGDKTEEDEYDATGTLLKKKTFAYNANGDLMFEMEYDASGKQLKKTAYGYDLKGLKIEKKVFGPGDVLEKDITYTYTY